MTSIYLVANLIDATIQIRKEPGNLRWSCHFEGAEISEGRILSSEFGVGENAGLALLDYCKKISGKKIVFNAESASLRREFTMPADLGV